MYNLLICDDERDIRNALKIYLSGEGYKIFEAENGEGGHGKLQNGKNGKDVYIKVPCGTVIKDFATNQVYIVILTI